MYPSDRRAVLDTRRASCGSRRHPSGADCTRRGPRRAPAERAVRATRTLSRRPPRRHSAARTDTNAHYSAERIETLMPVPFLLLVLVLVTLTVYNTLYAHKRGTWRCGCPFPSRRSPSPTSVRHIHIHMPSFDSKVRYPKIYPREVEVRLELSAESVVEHLCNTVQYSTVVESPVLLYYSHCLFGECDVRVRVRHGT